MSIIRLLIITTSVSLAFAQAPEEIEKRISQLSPERRAYERYHNWITTQPPATQRSADHVDLYREHLQKPGSARSR